MALTLGTNCGFVTTAPTDDPAGNTDSLSNNARVSKFTSPATAGKITEIGWWCDSATAESNFEVGLYAADGAVVPGEAGTLLEVSRTNAKGTTAGWKRVTVNWTISSNTVYWLGVQLDYTAYTTYTDFASSGFYGWDIKSSQASLPNPFAGGAIQDADAANSFYAVWEAAAGTNIKVNIADTWKDVSAIKVNIADAWKDVTSVKVNIADSWRTVF